MYLCPSKIRKGATNWHPFSGVNRLQLRVNRRFVVSLNLHYTDRLPVNNWMTKMIPAMTNNKWISPPPTFMTNPSSQKAISATIMIHSILPIFFTPSKWYSEFTRKLEIVNCLAFMIHH